MKTLSVLVDAKDAMLTIANDQAFITFADEHPERMKAPDTAAVPR